MSDDIEDIDENDLDDDELGEPDDDDLEPDDAELEDDWDEELDDADFDDDEDVDGDGDDDDDDDDDGDDDGDDVGEDREEALDELEAEELDMLTDDEESETLIVDEAQELRAIRRAEIALEGEGAGERADDEFVCQSCYLVLKTSQLANRRRMLCRDCAA